MNMPAEVECPICEADIPLEGTEKTGDLVLCSYCKVTFKILKLKDKLVLSEDFEE
jgi:Alpha-aminoadipate carrier protein LysW-like, globular domain